MSFSVIVSTLSAISSALKITEFVEDHGFWPTGQDLTLLNLDLAKEEPVLQRAAQRIGGIVGDAEDELFEDTHKRVADCLRSVKRSANDPDELPEEKRRLGRAGRKCVCTQVKIVRDLIGGQLPDTLDDIWNRYNCGSL